MDLVGLVTLAETFEILVKASSSQPIIDRNIFPVSFAFLVHQIEDLFNSDTGSPTSLIELQLILDSPPKHACNQCIVDVDINKQTITPLLRIANSSKHQLQMITSFPRPPELGESRRNIIYINN
jgi:hypothetical protein